MSKKKADGTSCCLQAPRTNPCTCTRLHAASKKPAMAGACLSPHPATKYPPPKAVHTTHQAACGGEEAGDGGAANNHGGAALGKTKVLQHLLGLQKEGRR